MSANRWWIAALTLALTGCASAGKKGGPESQRLHERVPGKIAVLPFANESTDLDAPGAVREAVIERLQRAGYAIESVEATDAALRGLGISEGGQLRGAVPAKIGKAVGVDGYIYGNILQFKNQNVGFYRNRAIELELQFVHAASGDILWKGQEKVTKKNVALNKEAAKRSFARGLVRGMVEKAVIKKPLAEETKLVLNKLFRKLPRR